MQLFADVDPHLLITLELQRNNLNIQHSSTSVYEDTKTNFQIRQNAITISQFSEQNFERYRRTKIDNSHNCIPLDIFFPLPTLKRKRYSLC